MDDVGSDLSQVRCPEEQPLQTGAGMDRKQGYGLPADYSPADYPPVKLRHPTSRSETDRKRRSKNRLSNRRSTGYVAKDIVEEALRMGPAAELVGAAEQ